MDRRIAFQIPTVCATIYRKAISNGTPIEEKTVPVHVNRRSPIVDIAKHDIRAKIIIR